MSIKKNVGCNVYFNDPFLTDTNLSEFQKTDNALLVKGSNNTCKRFFNLGFVKIKFIRKKNTVLFALWLQNVSQAVLYFFVVKWICWDYVFTSIAVIWLGIFFVFFLNFEDLFQRNNIITFEVDDFVDFLFVYIALDDGIKKICADCVIGKWVCWVGKLDDLLLDFFDGGPLWIVRNGHTHLLPGR